MKWSVYPLVVLLCACDGGSMDRWRVGETDNLTRLSVHLNSKYHRGLDKNDYQLTYETNAPASVRVRARYRPGADVGHIRSVVSEAEKNAKRVALEKYQLVITTQSVVEALP